jgi:DNA polymerase IV
MKPRKPSKDEPKPGDWWKIFTCMRKHDGLTANTNPNARTIEVLDQMARYYDRTNDHWRTTAYRKAISALKKKTEKVLTKEQALAMPFIGDRLASKIEEIVWTNGLRRLENIDKELNDKVSQTFLKVYGAGYAVAQKWIAQGHRSLQDLVEKASLTENQKVGVEHYDDFLARIPRSEVEAHGEIVRESFCRIDPEIQVTIGGSFRRGAQTSGDIDLIITKPGVSLDWLRDLLLETVIPELFKKGFLKVTLAALSHDHGSKWHGASALPDSTIWRRIDLLLVPWEEMGAALIYFTGNDIFNRSMRLLASKRGMRLNQHALFKNVMRGPGRTKLNEGTVVEGEDEKRIFDILGVPWRPPEHRNC